MKVIQETAEELCVRLGTMRIQWRVMYVLEYALLLAVEVLKLPLRYHSQITRLEVYMPTIFDDKSPNGWLVRNNRDHQLNANLQQMRLMMHKITVAAEQELM